MKKIRLTESELVSLIEKVVNESQQLNEVNCEAGKCYKDGHCIDATPYGGEAAPDGSCGKLVTVVLHPEKHKSKSTGLGSMKSRYKQGMRNESYKQGYRDALREMRNRI